MILKLLIFFVLIFFLFIINICSCGESYVINIFYLSLNWKIEFGIEQNVVEFYVFEIDDLIKNIIDELNVKWIQVYL